MSESARPRLVLHIGTHKTGTTAIQKTLQAHRDACLAQGVLYADTARAPWPELPKHTSVFQAAAHGDDAAQHRERDALAREFDASGAHTLVLSEEGLSEPLPHLARFFGPWAERFTIRVVCLLRRQDLFVESLYSQFVREAARREARPLRLFVRARSVQARLDYAQWLQPWGDLPGAELVVRDFDAVVRGPGLVAGFLDAAGLRLAPLPEAAANRSPDMRVALALQRLNLARRDVNLPGLLRAAQQLGAEGRFAPLRHLLGRDERLRLLQTWAPANERLAERHGVHFEPALPVGEAAAPVEDIEPAYLLEWLAAAAAADPHAGPDEFSRGSD